ncbi:uncharacterized protein LOC111389001 [Olea europaea var. sylvestris]|uniref:uncharacterized protein LOC111389001 n=1 Tax=Olea europaea var. sylvestris TaxID=158386 RepID=UPI000C1D751A|nr:uncharacterized protein LOC111389001 [Olea europaea var. sylvestris]
MNPLKCAFGAISGKFLDFVVRHQGIEIDQSKIDAIINMPEPRNVRELKSFQGKLPYIRKFISNLAKRCHPFDKLEKKDVPFGWDDACQNAFQSIKQYVSSTSTHSSSPREATNCLYCGTRIFSRSTSCPSQR